MSNLSFVTDVHNKFYAGMTLNEAKRRGIDKSFWHRDFNNIDANSDGVLSVSEILNERKRSSRTNKFCAAAFTLFGIFDFIGDKGKKGWMIADLVINGLIVAFELKDAYRKDKGTERIEEELNRRAIRQKLSVNG